MSYKNVGFMPDIAYPRSIFSMPKTHKTSWLHGDLVPLHCFRVQPGDSFSLKLSNIIRMSTPLVPFMDGIVMNIRAVFVPLRLLWEHWQEFIGANKGAGYQQNSYLLPANQLVNLADFSSWSQYANQGLSYALGKNLHSVNGVLNDTNVASAAYSVLKERGYYFIWNKLFRSTQLQAEYSVSLSDGTTISEGGTIYRYAQVLTSDNTVKKVCGHKLLKVNKMHDYFVDNCLSPQYGESVTIGLSDYAPVITTDDADYFVAAKDKPGLKFGAISSGLAADTGMLGIANSELYDDTSGTPHAGYKVVPTNLVADLTKATATTVNQLRYAFATQRWLERANYGGNNYYSIIAVHFGIMNPMATMQMPEYLGGVEYNINVNQVTNQSGFAAGTTTVLGEVGAVSVTARKDDFIFRKGFTEFGFVYILGYTKHYRSYGQGLPREDLLVDNKYELMWPEFMNIGDQKTLIAEIFAGSNTPLQGFGYQESWAEYKFFHDTVSGLLNPSLPSGSLGQWSLADYYSSEPNLSSSWLQEDRNAISRVLKTGATGPDFIGDFAFKYTASRIINIKKLPGLIDHVGLL